jgi:hypothetical protein
MEQSRQCIVGEYEGDVVNGLWKTNPDKYRCKNHSRSKDPWFDFQPSLCSMHHVEYRGRRLAYELDPSAWLDADKLPPSEQCRGCGDYTICPGLANSIWCTSCRGM